MISLIFLIIVYIILAVIFTVTETTSLISTDSLLKSYSFKKHNFNIYIYFRTYQGIASENYGNPTVTMKGTFMKDGNLNKSLTCVQNNSCKFEIETTEMISTGDYVQFHFKNYTSDIGVTLQTEPATNNEDSTAEQMIFTDSADYVFAGSVPSIFSFSLFPAIYSDTTIISSEVHKGFRISNITVSTKGSKVTEDYLYLQSGFDVIVEFTLSDSSVQTIHSTQYNGFAFLGALIGIIIGLYHGLGFIVAFSDWIYYRKIGIRSKTQDKIQTETEKARQRKYKPSVRKDSAPLLTEAVN